MKTGALYRGRDRAVETVWLADSWFGRLRGLLGRPPLAPGQGLLLSPCDGVHTFWMGYRLDVLFLDRAGRVLDWRQGVQPWRACRQRGARSTLELCSGGIAALRPVRGEVLQWQPTARPIGLASARPAVASGTGASATTRGMEPSE